MRYRKCNHWLFWLCLLVSTTVYAQTQGSYEIPEKYDFARPWEFFGTSTLHWDWYRNSGDPAAAHYPKVGPQVYEEMWVDFSRETSPYENWKGWMSGLYNDSEYRSDDEGFILEQFHLGWEKGNLPVPFKFEIGDHFGFYTYRTMQRSLKGLQLELQPAFGDLTKVRHSILLTAGAPLATYDEGGLKDDLYHGASWLTHADSTDLSLNVMRNSRQEDPGTGLPRREQTVYSLAANHRPQFFNQMLALEGEVAYLDGDLGGIGPNTGGEVDAMGYFLQMRGQSKSPLTYQFRFEDYDRFFQPNGAVVTPDRRTWDGRAGWRFKQGLLLNGRVQRFLDGKETDNSSTTDVIGLSLAGPSPVKLIRGLNMFLDGFMQAVENEAKTTDRRMHSVRLDLNAPISSDWSGRAGLSTQKVRNKLDATQTTSTYDAQLGATRRLAFLGFAGSIAPGIVLRKIKNASSTEDQLGLSLSGSLTKNAHSLAMSGRIFQQDQHVAGSEDLATNSLNLAYRYATGPHTLSLEADLQYRDPEDRQSSAGYLISLQWTFSFGKPARAPRKAPGVALAASEGTGREESLRYAVRLDLKNLRPGMSLAQAKASLAAAGISEGTELPGATVYEAPLFEELLMRQRLVLVHEAGRIKKTAVIVELTDMGDPDTAMQSYERIRRALMNLYGRPKTFERGQLSGIFASDINSGRVIRISEWETEAGAIRLGIPRRLDGQIRIEVQHAEQFPPFLETLWSVEIVQ